jgi:DUF1680 family protein
MALTITGNLLQIDVDKSFLEQFVAGGPGEVVGDGPYVGIGKTLDGMVRLAANTQNKALIERKKHVVQKLLSTVKPDGYIGLLQPNQRTWTLWDLHEQSYIIYALVSDYKYFGEKASLEAARKLADYIIGRWPSKPANWEKTLPANKNLCTIGLKAAFFAVYSETGDKRYLDFCVNELKAQEWDQEIVLGRVFPFYGHIYSYFCHCLVQLDLYRKTPQASLLTATQRAMNFLTTKDGMGITGGAGRDECWTDDQIGAGNFAETCATAYQIFAYDNLLRLGGDSRWGDMIERAVYNSAFAAQSPDGRRIRYYTAFEGKRVYFGSDTYCCPGNFRRMMAFIPEMIYYRAKGNRGLVVNLYTESQVTFSEGGVAVTVRQKTDYPSSGGIVLSVDPASPTKFPLLLRIPSWCKKARVAVNGKAIKTTVKAGAFVRIERTWKPGDKVQLELPMEWRFVAGRKAQAGRFAILRGPVVYTLNPLRNPGLSGVDLKQLVIQAASVELAADDTVRPGGTCCRVKAKIKGQEDKELTLVLDEFPDPDGELVYFLLSDPKVAVDDELARRIPL